jgi:signal transduction histidine kinase
MKPATVADHAADSRRAEVRPGSDERANRYDVVSRLADDLAHEIRNPLNAMVVNLEVLRRRIDSGAQDKAVELTRVIDQEITRLTRLVDQLVFLMRPPRSESNPTSLDETIEDMRPLLETQASAARVGFQLTTSSELFTRVPRDVVKFVLLNLITAVYADGKPARLEIAARAAGGAAEVVVTTEPGPFEASSEFVRRARVLAEGAGGTLSITEPAGGAAGSSAVLRIPGSSSFV